MQIYNTLSRKEEELKPLKPPEILMYHCGPTVYWTQHIGNMRAVVLSDLIVKTLNFLGYKVKLTRNFTDVGHLTDDGDGGEDKINKKAKEERISPEEISQKYIETFEKDIHLLNIPDPNFKPKATGQIKEMIEMIESLVKKDFAYSTDLAIYFDVTKANNYNKLSKQKIEDQIKYAGKAEVSDPNKKNPTDFALWFFKAGKHKNALQTWNSSFSSPLVENGEGFPGWHLECSVMAKKFLGDTIDIHMGGVEHIPIHHTNEIAQSESANGVKYVNYWIHNEHLTVNGNKMSKSEGTAYSLQEIINRGFDPIALRYFFLQAHYRSKQNFTWEALEASQNALNNLREKFSQLGHPVSKLQPQPLGSIASNFEEFKEIISNDFDIPNALAYMWSIIKNDSMPDENKRALILEFDKVFGLGLADFKIMEIPDEIKKLAQEREEARHNKNWQKSDLLRETIEKRGFEIKDTEEGYKLIWK